MSHFLKSHFMIKYHFPGTKPWENFYLLYFNKMQKSGGHWANMVSLRLIAMLGTAWYIKEIHVTGATS